MNKPLILILCLFAWIQTAIAEKHHLPFRVISDAEPPFYAYKNEEDKIDFFVKVLDAKTGLAISDAFVLLGEKEGSPFAENFSLTDENGEASFVHEYLRRRQAITATVYKEGYHVLSQFNMTAKALEIYLNPTDDYEENAFFEGKFTGWPTGYGNDQLELGLFMPAFRSSTLLNFDINKLISSYEVETDIRGPRMIPANIVFPKQRKRYMFFTINLNKPNFKMPLPMGFEANMGGFIGTIPIDKVVASRDDYLGIVNAMKVTHVQWTEPKQVDGDQNFEIHVDRALKSKAISSSYANIPPRNDTLALSLVDPVGDGEALVPLDLKPIKANAVRQGKGSLKLSSLKEKPEEANLFVFSAIFNMDEFLDETSPQRSFSGSLSKLATGESKLHTDGYLKRMKLNKVGADNKKYSFSSPINPQQDITPSYIVLNIYAETTNENIQGHSRKLLWSSVLSADATEAELPEFMDHPVLPEFEETDVRYFWEVIAVRHKEESNDTNFRIENLEYLSGASAAY